MRAAAIFALILVVGVIYFMTTWDNEEEEEFGEGGIEHEEMESDC